MGGLGSGSWSRWNSKRTTESQRRVDIRWLRKQGSLRPGTTGTISWSCRGEKTGEIGFRTEPDRMILFYNRQINGGEWEAINEVVQLDRTPCNYGAERTWFLCPRCSRRVVVLYGAGRLFLCRHCYRLTYTSQQESPPDRLMERACAIRVKLGGGNTLLDPFPHKPKHMHWRTYWRLRAVALAAENHGWAAAAKKFGLAILEYRED